MKHQWRFQLILNRNQVEISMEYQWKSIKNPVEISIKYQWKFLWNTIENTNGNSLEIKLKVNKIPMEIHWKLSLNFNEIPLEIHWKSTKFFNEIAVEISMKYQWKPLEIQFIIQKKFQ